MNVLIRLGQWYALCAVLFLGLFPIYLTKTLAPGNSPVEAPSKFSLYSYPLVCLYCAWTIYARKKSAKNIISMWAILSIVISPWKNFFHLDRVYFYLPIILVLVLALWFLSPVCSKLFEQPSTGGVSS